MNAHNFPRKQGLYDPAYEKDACGVGFVCDIKGQKSHTLLKQGLSILKRLEHRGAVGADPETGDGAGILIQMPHAFFKKITKKENIVLPKEGFYGTGLVFLPQDAAERKKCIKTFEKIVKDECQEFLGWRKVPVNSKVIGKTARESQPVIMQPFIKRENSIKDILQFERKLYVIRKQIELIIRSSSLKQKSYFYITNLSARTFSYKGLLMTAQVEQFFLDLQDTSLKTALAIVHSRYSTNTFPTWDLAQPFRFLAHNGEINTLRGNYNWMHAREGMLESDLFGNDIEKIKPVITPNISDSASIDNAIELLLLSGRSIYHSLLMLIPSAWEQDSLMDKKLKDFYKFHACLMEPWDGPAAIAVTDGTQIGAILDRNGLRPARYLVTKSGLCVMASEVGVLDIAYEDIESSGRLEPGKIFFIDTAKGKIITDEAIKKNVSTQKPYHSWVKKHLVDFESLPKVRTKTRLSEPIVQKMKSFGYTREDLKDIIAPMAQSGKEPTGSMGADFPHSVLSKKPQLLYTYFKQLFAQVTNPAIDPIREEIVMGLDSFIGQQKNILTETPEHCHKLYVKQPIFTNSDLEKIKKITSHGFKVHTISLLFDSAKKGAFKKRLFEICQEAEVAVKNGNDFVILSDRGTSLAKCALPALLATGRLHQYLIRKTLRTQIGIIVESAEPREVHHFACLFGFGADCINPYLAFDILGHLIKQGEIQKNISQASDNYRNALNKGILKILSKMGISTLQSYRGAQIFEAIGIHDEVMSLCFQGTASRIGGATFDIIEKETLIRHKSAYESLSSLLDPGGIYQWKRDGEFHLWNPDSIAAIQEAVKNNDYEKYKEFATLINDQSNNPTTLRSVLKFKKCKKISLNEVEPVDSIVKRFVTGAMSFGSISKGAHETLAIAMNRLGGQSNTGEGGENPVRFKPMPNGDSARSAIKQVASGRFGVNTNYLINADEIQIKIAQGAKPGEGGQLPGHKVSEIIAQTRFTTPGVTLISPPPHHDIYSIEDLKQLIFDLKNVNPSARISVKLVSEIGVGTIAAGVSKGHADMILISGGDGGTGASPKSSIRHAGLPWELGLSETHQTLVLNDLRSRVRLQTDGQMRTGRDVAMAAILGAEEYGFCTAALIVMGCVMLRHCHFNNCSVGVATQDTLLQCKFKGNPDHVVNYMRFIAQDLREIMANLGIRTIEELIGRTDLVDVDKKILPWKAKKIDFKKILYRPKVSNKSAIYKTVSQNHEIDSILDWDLIENSRPALQNSHPVIIRRSISNVDRTTGATLSGEVCKHYGGSGMLDNTIHCIFKGEAGQSFGAWLAKGITFELEGLANDYVGKGISGGRIIVYPNKTATYKAEENVLIGNTTFYGAISGEAYIRGKAGERFCIRNSGLYAVVEGVGDHACEYMTGGRVLILGETGRNFAAGMSGGIAYVYDSKKNFSDKCNMSMVEIDSINEDDATTIFNLLRNHVRFTQSPLAENMLTTFEKTMKKIVKVIPLEYKRIIDVKRTEELLGLTQD